MFVRYRSCGASSFTALTLLALLAESSPAQSLLDLRTEFESKGTSAARRIRLVELVLKLKQDRVAVQPFLLLAVTDQDPTIRQRVLTALRKDRPERSDECDSLEEVLQQPGDGLGGPQWFSSVGLPGGDDGDRADRIANHVVDLGAADLRAVELTRRIKECRFLIDETEIIDAILAHAEHGDHRVRRAVAMALLDQLHHPGVFPALLARLGGDERQAIRLYLAGSLAPEIPAHREAFVAELLRVLANQSAFARVRFIKRLGEFPDLADTIVPPLVQITLDDSERLACVSEAIGSLGRVARATDRELITRVGDFLGRDGLYLAVSAILSLGHMGRCQEQLAPSVLTLLLQHREHESSSCRHANMLSMELADPFADRTRVAMFECLVDPHPALSTTSKLYWRDRLRGYERLDEPRTLEPLESVLFNDR